MNRTDILNILAKKINAQTYLEIGVDNGISFEKIKVSHRIGVDPNKSSPATYHMTSDEYFAHHNDKFDLIFVDGLHLCEQVEKDIENSLKRLNTGGYIVCHDANPPSEEYQIVPYSGGAWTGDVWKAIVNLRKTRRDLKIFTVDTDFGCSVIQVEPSETLEDNKELTYKNLDQNRKLWLNLISEKEFYDQFRDDPLDNLLLTYINNPVDPEINWKLALYYHDIGQTASAVSFYIRAAERATDTLVQYECLIRASMCFASQGTRGLSVRGLLQRAISVLPSRPEAYFLLSRYYEKENAADSWFNSYMISCIGDQHAYKDLVPLRTEIDYPGSYGCLFQKAISSWWCGLCGESRELFKELITKHPLNESFRNSVIFNLKRLNELVSKEISFYNDTKHKDLIYKFPGSENIKRNYSESYQDMFILSMLNGKKQGKYLEIGAGNTFHGNNTALLETEFGWTGVSLDIDERFVQSFAKERKNPCLLKDATLVDYEKFLTGQGFEKDIDYLQLDCDPPDVTYKVLCSIPFETRKFAIITYEHDYYCDESKSFREKSRKYLTSYGYKLVAGNIAPDNWRNYEDWWVHPDLVDPNILKKLLPANDETKKAEDYLLGRVPMAKSFDWGEIAENNWFLNTVIDEIFTQDIYQKFFKVEPGETVVDIGASVGPFTHHILKQKPQKVYCLEPHKKLFKTLSSNLFDNKNVVLINKGIADQSGEVIFKGLYNKDSSEMWSKEDRADAITFRDFIKEYGISTIDFLKTDCEGGEYDIFTEENFDWIQQNVRKISGEWHLSNDYLKQKFRQFRDLYLKNFPNHQVYSMDGIDIKWALWSDEFINYYATITVWIDNSVPVIKNTAFDWGSLEKNTWMIPALRKEFEENNYEKFFSVEQDDVVVDIGASAGPFAFGILKQKPSKVICLEPHSALFQTLKKNFDENHNVICLNQGIAASDANVLFTGLYNDDLDSSYVGDQLWSKTQLGQGITFKTLIQTQNLNHIDFLKIDCEGGEYDVFNEENFDWIMKNVRKIVGEWHFHSSELKEKFLKFRDLYLKQFQNYRIFFVDADSNFYDIKSSLWDDSFVHRYAWVNIYIDNRNS